MGGSSRTVGCRIMGSALLFDLDDTLMVEEQAAAAAFDAAAQVAVARHEIDTATLAVDARSRARELWYADVDGALGAGLGAIWVNRDGRIASPDRTNLVEVSTLGDLQSALGE